MATDAEIEAGAAGMYGKSWDDADPQKRPGDKMKDVWRRYAKAAIEGADAFRAEFKRKHCKHPNKSGTGMVCSDGSSSWDWFCPDCGKSGGSKTEGRQDRTGVIALMSG